MNIGKFSVYKKVFSTKEEVLRIILSILISIISSSFSVYVMHLGFIKEPRADYRKTANNR
jgi:hypothetical protein